MRLLDLWPEGGARSTEALLLTTHRCACRSMFQTRQYLHTDVWSAFDAGFGRRDVVAQLVTEARDWTLTPWRKSAA